MSREFEIRKEVELAATPEQVWEAIATGPGHSSWFMGPYEIEPAEGGVVKLAVGDETEVGKVTAWDPPHRFANRSAEGEDGSFHAFEYLVEGREGGSTVLRFVHSGVTGDDWHDEYESMTEHGWDVYLFTLSQYLRYFPGRFATFITANGPQEAATKEAWDVLMRGLGLSGPVEEGDEVRLTPAGLAPIEGVVDIASDEFLGVRTEDSLYRFHGLSRLDMPYAVGHHMFGEIDPMAEMGGWTAFLHGLFPGAAEGSGTAEGEGSAGAGSQPAAER